MLNAAPFLSLRNVSIRLQDQILFEGLTWEMCSDQHWAVLGPNGSGKSTLMRALTGALPIVNGEIVYHFRNGHGAPTDQIGHVTFESQRMVLGDEAFYQARWNAGVNEDTLTVSEFLSEQAVGRGSSFQVIETLRDPEFHRRQGQVVGQLELASLLERPVVQLSNGERRKVTIARALLKNPRLLILDNPFAGLDERFRTKLGDHLDDLMRGEMRLLIVGTRSDELPAGITHVLQVRDRHVTAQGPRAHLAKEEQIYRRGTSRHPSHETLPTYSASPENGDTARSGRALVHMDNVNVAYNGTPVLRQVNWTIRENERWALLGPNGAGKTTLLSLILADNPQAYANHIALFGKRRGSGESIWEIKQHIGWVAPELHLYYPRGATCFEVVCSGWFDSVGLYREPSPDQKEGARIWLRRFDLDGQAMTRFAEVSEGEQRLVLLARALVKRPTLLVLDEPCQGLDPENRDRVLQAIERVGSEPNTSMIYVTHRADELFTGITHVLRLNQGQVVEQGRKRGDDGQLRSDL